MMTRLLLVALVLSIPLSAKSQVDPRWEFIDADGDRAVYYDSKRPINRKADVRKVWGLTTYREAQNDSAGAYQSSITLYFANCKDYTFGVAYSGYYKETLGNGATVLTSGNTAAPPAQAYRSTVPGSWGETIVKAMCK